MFAAFIVSCGATHWMEVLTTYVPLYRLSALVKFETAIVSWITFAAMLALVPRALAFPRRDDLEREVRERKRAQEELVRAQERLEERVVERTAELARANHELDRSNRDLDDFAHLASHDLKEPLRGIGNFARFLLEDYGEKLDGEGRSKLETLTRLARNMDNLIDCLLQYSRVGRVDLAIAATDLNEVVAEVLESSRISLQEQGGEVRLARPLPTLRCDRARVGEIFRNLITNAVKYNDKPRKQIEVGYLEAEPAPDGEAGPPPPIVFFVRDNGIGIPERHREDIFRMFKRLHGREKYGDGTGLGLSIAKKIVERHGGRIWLESKVGEGSTFYFTLEREPHERALAPCAVD